MMRCIVVGVLLGALGLTGCSATEVEEPDVQITTVQLAPGSRSTYHWSYVQEDSLGQVMYAEEDTVRVQVAAQGERLGAYDDLIRVEAYAVGAPEEVEDDWYLQTERTLVSVAYRNKGAVPLVSPKSQDATGPPWEVPRTVGHLLMQEGTSAAADTTTWLREEARVVYQYPMQVGQEWTSFRRPFLSSRKVVGWEEVTVAAGTFTCVKIRTHIPKLEPGLVWYDYVAPEGLVLRTVERTIQQRDPQNRPIGTVQLREWLVLASQEAASKAALAANRNLH